MVIKHMITCSPNIGYQICVGGHHSKIFHNGVGMVLPLNFLNELKCLTIGKSIWAMSYFGSTCRYLTIRSAARDINLCSNVGRSSALVETFIIHMYKVYQSVHCLYWGFAAITYPVLCVFLIPSTPPVKPNIANIATNTIVIRTFHFLWIFAQCLAFSTNI